MEWLQHGGWVFGIDRDICAVRRARLRLKQWEERNDVDMYVTVDKGDESWQGREGFVPAVLQEVAPSTDNAIVLVCGPPIMLKSPCLPY